jgi:putative iron-only hydrogenase system regulator
MNKRIAIIGAVIENPVVVNEKFNTLVAEYQGIIRGRMGIPFHEEKVSVVSITLVGDLDEINSLTGKLGNLAGEQIKTLVSKKEL